MKKYLKYLYLLYLCPCLGLHSFTGSLGPGLGSVWDCGGGLISVLQESFACAGGAVFAGGLGTELSFYAV